MEYSHNSKLGNKKTILGLSGIRSIILLFIIVFFVIGGFLIYSNAKDKNDNKKASNSAVQGTITYPSGWVEIKPDQSEQQSGIIIKAARDNPYISFQVKSRQIVVGTDYDISGLPDKVVAKLKKEISGFQLTSKSVVKIGKYDAVQIRYKQASAKDKEGSLFIIPTPSTSYYLTFVNDKDNYATVKDQINQVAQSFASYIDQHSN